MYRRFLNDSDYAGLISKDTLTQITRGSTAVMRQAEESAEMSIREYLSESYEVEQELNKGKYIAEYDRKITYPVGVCVYKDGIICEVIRALNGYKAPATVNYWKEFIDDSEEEKGRYSQFKNYQPGEVVVYNDVMYECVAENGYDFENIRIPMVSAWKEIGFKEWEPRNYQLWDVVAFDGCFYTLIHEEGFDNNIDPQLSGCWGAIADYDREYNKYELNGHDYVVVTGRVFVPEIDPNPDEPVLGENLIQHDSRNYNLKKHMLRLAVYELTKLIAPNNVSIVRIKDYENSMKWLSDAAKLKINPQIPRKLTADKKAVTDWQMATFQTKFNPYENPWLT